MVPVPFFPYFPCSTVLPFCLCSLLPVPLKIWPFVPLFPLFPNSLEGLSDESPPPPPSITQTLNRKEYSIPKHFRFNFQNMLCVSYNVVAVPIIKSDLCFFYSFWKHDPIPRIWNFSCCFIQNWEKLTPYIIIKLNIKFTN